jgi:hypothetical protein
MKSMTDIALGHNGAGIAFVALVTCRTDKLEIFCHFKTPVVIFYFFVEKNKKLSQSIAATHLYTVFELGLRKFLPLIQNITPVGQDERFAAVIDQLFHPVKKSG